MRTRQEEAGDEDGVKGHMTGRTPARKTKNKTKGKHRCTFSFIIISPPPHPVLCPLSCHGDQRLCTARWGRWKRRWGWRWRWWCSHPTADPTEKQGMGSVRRQGAARDLEFRTGRANDWWPRGGDEERRGGGGRAQEAGRG